MAKKSNAFIKRVNVKLEGLSDIMFDKFIDHKSTNIPPEQKLYLADENKVVLPSTNITDGFLFGQFPAGCAMTFSSKSKEGKEYVRVGMGHIFVDPMLIPFTKDGKEVIFRNFENGDFWIDRTAGRAKGQKMEAKARPVMRLPWSLEFQIGIVENQVIDENRLYNWFTHGGLIIALGTFRPKFGRFGVAEWKLLDT